MDDRLELGRFVEDHAQRDAEALAQRPRHQPRARGRADQGERRQVDAHRARRRPLADHQVELEVLHRGIEDLLDRRIEAMDLVDEQHVVRLQVGELGGEIARLLDHRARGRAEADAHLARHDLRQRRLAEAGRAVEQHVVERLAARLGGGDEDLEVLADLLLADEVVERLRPQRQLGGVLLGALAGATSRSRRRRSSRQLLQAGTDHRIERRARTQALRHARDGAERLDPAIAEIDQRRDRVLVDRGRRRTPAPAASVARAGAGATPKAAALSFSSVTRRAASFGPTPAGRLRLALSPAAIARAISSGDRVERIDSATRAPTPCTVVRMRNQSRSAVVEEAVERDRVLAHDGLDQQRRRRRRPRGRARCATRPRPDSRRRSRRSPRCPRRPNRRRPSAWRSKRRLASRLRGGAVMGMADRDGERVGGIGASPRRRAAGGRPSSRPGCLSAWPAPTTDFFTRLAAYSNTGRPARAGASITTPRAWPSFRVEAGLTLTKVSSTAASIGLLRGDHRGDALEQLVRAARPASRSVGTLTTPCATWRSRLPSTSITPQPVSRRPGSRPISRIARSGRELRQSVVRHFEIGVDVLDVVVVLEGVDQVEQRLARSRPRPASWSWAATSAWPTRAAPSDFSSASRTALKLVLGAVDLVRALLALAAHDVVGAGLDRLLEHVVGRAGLERDSGTRPCGRT